MSLHHEIAERLAPRWIIRLHGEKRVPVLVPSGYDPRVGLVRDDGSSSYEAVRLSDLPEILDSLYQGSPVDPMVSVRDILMATLPLLDQAKEPETDA